MRVALAAALLFACGAEKSAPPVERKTPENRATGPAEPEPPARWRGCLLYTSDAADE